MIGQPCFYKKDVHILIHPPLLRWVKNQIADDNLRESLFCYLQRQYGTFVIGQWIDTSRSMFVDILNMGQSLGSFDRDDAQELLRRLLRPTTVKETKDAMRKGASDWRLQQENENAELSERQERCRDSKITVGYTGKRKVS